MTTSIDRLRIAQALFTLTDNRAITVIESAALIVVLFRTVPGRYTTDTQAIAYAAAVNELTEREQR